MRIAPRFFQDVPERRYRLTVKADRTACGPPPDDISERLDQMEKEGVELTLSQIVTAAATLYTFPKTDQQQDIKQAWSILETWSYPTSEDRFIAEPPENDKLQSDGVEALGMGVGVLIAEKLFALPLPFWQRTQRNASFDYYGVRPETGQGIALSPIGLEARARLDRNHWQEAVAQAADKLRNAATRDFATAVAVLFAPRSQPMQRAARAEDVLIMDPENNNFAISPSEKETVALRALLRHYAPFFLQQGGSIAQWGQRLLELADADPKEFAQYLEYGDPELQYDKDGLNKPWRTFFRYDGERFCGSAFTGDRWPEQLNGTHPASETGQFYWGIWESIIEALRNGRLQDIAQMQVKSGETHSRGRVFVLQSDGIALAWAPNAVSLNPGLFDDLLPDDASTDTSDRIPTAQR